ncbi:hypothetical protein OEV98_16455 [Caldibacillus lycopersici]|uniref:8-amino-7-oxononanoate synthase n=1 Tax=Perspicuibacillus lycopersici TaxID=1325689 RepID=A0AAE3LRW6_9BACI|nr:hypothetical protein [Perspicuibacillus lycopersici]MCU9615129.1 hypothetical protein [Perspicuibacillus lycopersici]
MKKLIVSAVFVLLLAFALPLNNKAEAAYNPENDIYLEFNLPFDIPFLTEDLAYRMFNIQEALQRYLREHHNIDMEYSYIWIVINGKVVLAIDPPLVVDNGH